MSLCGMSSRNSPPSSALSPCPPLPALLWSMSHSCVDSPQTPTLPPITSPTTYRWWSLSTETSSLSTTVWSWSSSGNPNPPLVSKAPGFHRFGVWEKSKVNRVGQIIKTKTHRFSWFREAQRDRKLHLTNAHRTTMGRAVVNYFVGQFSL